MADPAENFDDMTEEQLADARGDNYDPEKVLTEEHAPQEDTSLVDSAEGDDVPPADSAEGDDVPPADSAEGDDVPPVDTAQEDTPRPVMLPKSRYDSMKGRMDRENEQLREELAQLRQGAQQQQVEQAEQPTLDSQLAELDAGITKAMADGEHEQAAQLMASARRMERQAFQQALQHTSQNTSTQAQQSMEYDMFIDQLESARPELDAESGTFDEALSNEVVDLMQAFATRGGTPKQALEKALAYTFPEGWQGVPASKEEQAPPPRATDVSKNIETAQNQPPRMDAGVTSDQAGMGEQIDVMALSDEEFDKLTDAQLARLRGDDG